MIVKHVSIPKTTYAFDHEGSRSTQPSYVATSKLSSLVPNKDGNSLLRYVCESCKEVPRLRKNGMVWIGLIYLSWSITRRFKFLSEYESDWICWWAWTWSSLLVISFTRMYRTFTTCFQRIILEPMVDRWAPNIFRRLINISRKKSGDRRGGRCGVRRRAW